MHFFGPPSKKKDMLLYWGIKTRTNESLREEFFSTYVPKMWDLGISVPDPELRFENDAWIWSDPGWDDFWDVVRNKGPMSQTRLMYRKAIWDSHSWLRDVFNG